MTIKTKSAFYYIDEIIENNNYLNFIEPNQDNVELTAILDVGSYTPTDLATQVQSKLNQTGKVNYTVTFDRDTREFTIAGDDDFDLLVATGSNSGFSAYPVIGFQLDQAGAQTYTGAASGSEYLPQLELQDYKDKNDNIENIQSSINQSSSGIVEVVTFGRVRYYEFNVKYITNKVTKGITKYIEYRDDALADIRSFMEFATRKQNLEFMPDRSDRSAFDTVLLEQTRSGRDGTSYELRELIGQGLEGYFETGRLRFRVIE